MSSKNHFAKVQCVCFSHSCFNWSFDCFLSVKVSNRLADTPGVVVTSKIGWSSNMERIMAAQTLSDPTRQAYMKSKRILEINSRHPIIQELRQKVALNSEVCHYFSNIPRAPVFSLNWSCQYQDLSGKFIICGQSL